MVPPELHHRAEYIGEGRPEYQQFADPLGPYIETYRSRKHLWVGTAAAASCLVVLAIVLAVAWNFKRQADPSPQVTLGSAALDESTTTELYDCVSGYSEGAVDSWTEDQKSWCCQTYARGCSTSPSLPFDCWSGLTDWQGKWKSVKKQWCCVHAGLGCPTTSTLPFNCQESSESQDKWALDKKAWCCTNHGVGCPTTTAIPFDCFSQFSDWAAAWSDAQKSFCCLYFSRGCPTTVPPYDCEAAEEGYTQQYLGAAYIRGARGAARRLGGEPTKPAAGNLSARGVGAVDQEHALTVAASQKLPQGKQQASPAPEALGPLLQAQRPEEGWSLEKRDWCCSRFNTGCDNSSTTPAPYDCDQDFAQWNSKWSEEQKEYCCVTFMRGCNLMQAANAAPHNCYDGFTTWEKSWAQEKKEWCCMHAGRGCPQTTQPPHDCNADLANWTFAWTLAKKSWCCLNQHKGCHTTSRLPYDCYSDYDRRESTWPLEQKAWCCQYQARGCPTTTTQVYLCSGNADRWAKAEQEWCCSHGLGGCPHTTTAPYDCPAELDTLEGEEDDEPPSTTAAKTAEAPHAAPSTKTAPGAAGNGSSQRSLAVVRAASESQRAWCCLYHNRGCPAPQQLNYNCSLSAAGEMEPWSDRKRLWCCTHYGRGCPTTTESPHDCYEEFDEWEAKWNPRKKAWCCMYFNRGCPSLSSAPHDCYEGFGEDGSEWPDVWSKEKQAWCCQQYGRGCVVTSKPLYDCYADAESSWSDEQQQWCCQEKGRGCNSTTPLPFDCLKDYEGWNETWPTEKKAWCCLHESRGCQRPVDMRFDCNEGDLASWTEEKKTWCCANLKLGCGVTEGSTAAPTLPESPPLVPVPMVTPLHLDALPTEDDGPATKQLDTQEQDQADGDDGDSYDCEAGIVGWTTNWDAAKKMWCCRHEGRGCAPMLDAGADGRAVSDVSTTNAVQGDTSNRRLREA